MPVALRLAISVDIDGQTIASHTDLYAAVHEAISAMVNTHGASTPVEADEVGVIFDRSGSQIGLWSVGPPCDNDPALRARALVAEERAERIRRFERDNHHAADMCPYCTPDPSDRRRDHVDVDALMLELFPERF